MQEFSSISASAYDAEALVPQLNEKSAEGWSIVSIVSAGTNVVAYLTRESSGEAAGPTDAAEHPAAAPAAAAVGATAAAAATEGASTETPAAAPVDEPAGWGAVTEATTSSPVDPGTTAAAEPEAPAAPEPEPAPESTVPAGWYADPSSRFELRYWDGHQWTEHVSRDGQQFTDPPVA